MPIWLQFTLPCDIEHKVLDFLRISEVCTMQTVAKPVRDRISSMLTKMPWDVTYRKESDGRLFEWLRNLCESRVKIRAVNVVRTCGTSYTLRLLRHTVSFQFHPRLHILRRRVGYAFPASWLFLGVPILASKLHSNIWCH